MAKIITPQEAWGWEYGQWQPEGSLDDFTDDLAHTVATEPERIREAVEAERECWMSMTQEQIDIERGLW